MKGKLGLAGMALVASLGILGCNNNHFDKLNDGFMIQGYIDGRYLMIEHHELEKGCVDLFTEFFYDAQGINMQSIDCGCNGQIDKFFLANLECYSPTNQCTETNEVLCEESLISAVNKRLKNAKEGLNYYDALKKFHGGR